MKALSDNGRLRARTSQRNGNGGRPWFRKSSMN
jgi:hypothetical protein